MTKWTILFFLLSFSTFGFAFEFNGNWEGEGQLLNSEVQYPIHEKLRVVVSHLQNQLEIAICMIELDKEHDPKCFENEYTETRGIISKKMTGEIVGEITSDKISIIDFSLENENTILKNISLELTEKDKMNMIFNQIENQTNHKLELQGSLIRE